jgi:plasmid stabilization system protein ParE
LALRIVLKPAVADDLRQIIDYLDQHNVDASDRWLQAVFAALEDLAQMPGKGSPKRYRTKQLEGVRSWLVPGFRNYVIFYQASDEALTVLGVVHGARDVRKLLRGRR